MVELWREEITISLLIKVVFIENFGKGKQVLINIITYTYKYIEEKEKNILIYLIYK